MTTCNENWIEVGYDFPKRVTDHAHASDTGFAEQVGHKDGFCVACAEIYVAINTALIELENEHPRKRRFRLRRTG